MSNVELFKFEETNVRVLAKNEDEVWFCLKDVCDVLELSNPTMVMERLKPQGVTKFNLGGRSGESNFIDEKNLYRVIFQSRKPQAERFQDWVYDEVLPSVRKHGAYMTDQVLEKTLQDPDFMIGLLTQLKDEREKRAQLEVKSKQQEQQIAEMKPKVDYVDTYI